MSVTFENAVHRYRGSGQGVDGVSLEVQKGELVAVIGASGCGKSTLLRLVAGLLPLQAGRLLIDGKEMQEVPAWQRSVGMVFQSYALFPHLDVLDNVAYGLRMRGVETVARRRKAQAMLDMVGLSEHAHRRPSQLSGGQQQRVALARALANRPKLLIADEPTGELDTNTSKEILALLRRIVVTESVTVLMSSHDPLALENTDRVVELKDGRVAN